MIMRIFGNGKFLLLFALTFVAMQLNAAEKPHLTLDEFFNSVSIDRVRTAPDGQAVVIAASQADWEKQVFRSDLWLYRNGALMQLTNNGHYSEPQWSPDGKWIAFLSERKLATGISAAESSDSDTDRSVTQVYVIPINGGEAFAMTTGKENVHAFAWSIDSTAIYYATRIPWSKAQDETYKKEWKDVERYRDAERVDAIASIRLVEAQARLAARGTSPASEEENVAGTPGSITLARTPFRVRQLAISPDGKTLAFNTDTISQRQEDVTSYEIYCVDLTHADPQVPPQQLTKNQAIEEDIRWAPDSRHLFFAVRSGSVDGNYEDIQGRVYWLDINNRTTQRWAANFAGNINEYSVTEDGGILAVGRLGTEAQLYKQASPGAPFIKLSGLSGTYETLALASHSHALAFVYSTLQQPAEVYWASGTDQLQQAQAVTSFNHLFTERELPQGKPYRWMADDGTPVEGMLIYPPGKFGARNLRTLTLIHGGPADADGNHFEADWYQWAALAGTQGWLVFEPNYRGSTGYGDDFMRGIIIHIVSRPGKDILEGLDALVKDGIADPNRLTIGGYSYGGYMTNWLITQTTRFKAAVTGAGAVEHAANWGNDDTVYDDAYFLGGLPWEAQKNYNDEAALFQFNKVHTPTHLVAGEDDIRVAVAEDYLMDRALHELKIPSSFLIFPEEGHSLDKNPWHGKIKVREELKWLEEYCPASGSPVQMAGSAP